jgi:hypothetical protein
MTLPRRGHRVQACLLALVAQARTICIDALVYLDTFLADLLSSRVCLGLRGLADADLADDACFFRNHRFL